MTAARTGPRLLLLHVSGADWQLAQPLVDAGRMPQLRALIDRGTIGNLATGAPRTRPTLATTVATGKRANGHGVLGYTKPDHDSPLGVRPVESRDLTATPIWEIVTRAGLKAAAVGWPVSHPATVFEATVVSDAFAEAQGATFDDWPLQEHAVSDPVLRQALAEFRLHPTDVTAEMVEPFLPAGYEIDQETDERLALLVATLARAASVHGAATWIAEHRDWNLLAVHFDLMERLSSAFLQHRAPRMAHVTQTDHRIYGKVVDGAYQFFDMLLGRYLELAGSDCRVLLASDHGYLVDDLRPLPPDGHTGAWVNHTYRELGILAVAGPGIKHDELVFGATIQDVVPTALALLGLRARGDLDGRILTDLFETPGSRNDFDDEVDDKTVDEVDDVMPHFAARWSDEADWELAGRRLVEYSELGYHALPPSDPELAYEMAEIQWLGNLAQVYLDTADHDAALDTARQLLALSPDHPRGLQQAAHCHLALGNLDACRQALNDLTATDHETPSVMYLFARLASAEGDMEAARTYLEKAGATDTGGVAGLRLLVHVGGAHLSHKRLDEAERMFRHALDIDPGSALAQKGLGATLLERGRYREAADHFRHSLSGYPHQADVHCDLGQCLHALGELDDAAEAYRRSLEIKPELVVPQQALKKIKLTSARRAAREAVRRWSSL